MPHMIFKGFLYIFRFTCGVRGSFVCPALFALPFPTCFATHSFTTIDTTNAKTQSVIG